MNRNNKKEKKIHPKVVFSLCIFICAVLFLVSLLKPQMIRPVKDAIASVITPIQSGINQYGTMIFHVQEEKKTKQELQDEIARLQSEIDQLTDQNTKLSLDNYELARLRELFELSENYLDYETTGARIIAKDPGNWFSQYTIDKGSKDGLSVGMNVLVGHGLMGIITEVGESYAIVRAIIDDTSNVSCMVVHSSELGILEGSIHNYEDGFLNITGLKKEADLSVGDAIVTSNVSSLYLPGILVGYISEVVPDENNITVHCKVTLASKFSNLNEVIVILNTKMNGAKE